MTPNWNFEKSHLDQLETSHLVNLENFTHLDSPEIAGRFPYHSLPFRRPSRRRFVRGRFCGEKHIRIPASVCLLYQSAYHANLLIFSPKQPDNLQLVWITQQRFYGTFGFFCHIFGTEISSQKRECFPLCLTGLNTFEANETKIHFGINWW